MGLSRREILAWKHKAIKGWDKLRKSIDGLLEKLSFQIEEFYKPEGRIARQRNAYFKQIALHSLKVVLQLSVADLSLKHADMSAQLIKTSKALHPDVVLANTFTTRQRRLATVTATRIYLHKFTK